MYQPVASQSTEASPVRIRISTSSLSRPNTPTLSSSSEIYSDNDDEVRGGNGTVLSGSINLLNTIMGTGMLAMPLAVASVGLGLGIIMIAIAGGACILGLYLLTKCAESIGNRKTSFFACTSTTLPGLSIFFDAAIAIKCFGVISSYLIVGGNLIGQVVASIFSDISPVWTLKSTWVSISLLLVSPLAYSRHLTAFKYTGALALLSVVYLIFVVLGFALFPTEAMPPKLSFDEIHWFNFSPKIFSALPIFVYAFTCHHNIFSVYNELEQNTPTRMMYVISNAVGSAFVIYQIIGCIGYITFGNDVGSNIIAMYPPSPVISGGQLAIATLVLLSYPLQLHPLRASLDKVITGGRSVTFSMRRLRYLTTAIIIGSYVVALNVDNLSTILALVGATGGTTICYILPGVMYYRMRKMSWNPEQRNRDIFSVLSIILAVTGVLIMFISLGVQFSGSVLH